MRLFVIGSILILAACSDGGRGGSALDPDLRSTGDAASPHDGGGGGGPIARTGLEGSCDKYKACGGTYYGTAQDCIDAAIDYWGLCRKAQLDAFGDCMRMQDCSLAGSDGYIPSQTPCADQYSALASSSCN